MAAMAAAGWRRQLHLAEETNSVARPVRPPPPPPPPPPAAAAAVTKERRERRPRVAATLSSANKLKPTHEKLGASGRGGGCGDGHGGHGGGGHGGHVYIYN
jgi:hypothetical protein